MSPTQTPCRPAASPATLTPGEVVLTTLLARGAICVTVSSSRFATQMYPAPAATSAGRTPVGMVPTNRLDSGSITASELAVARSGSDASSPAAKIAATAAASRIAPPAAIRTAPRLDRRGGTGARRRTGASIAGSCRRIDCSSAWSSRLGSSPSWSANARRASW